MKKNGLVLEGGGMRALFTAGVLDAFLEKSLCIDTMVSVSAGALFGVNYVSQQKERAVRYNIKFAGDKRYMSLKNWFKTGNVLDKKFAYYDLPMKLDVFDEKKFSESNINFYIVLTNIETGKAEYILIKDVFDQMEYLRATSALPFASKIIKIDGKKYLDGGITDPVPIDYCKKMGCDKLIVVLTRPKGKYKEDKLNWLFKIVYKKYPKLVERLVNMENDYKKTLKKIIELEDKGEIFVIRPDEVLDIGRLETNKEKIKEIYNKGLEKGRKEIEKLEKYLNK
ncbi:patatin-like phospholipase family protein [Fusobacterium massiliense]|uniref:patatin-like phospholipase family protein n=1 Tax=Fusobacterium massiliense TaxID=1852365 RepID=UPI00093CD2E1|nr:patatin-like phospholipase family protein [Fusobacterium massiliense]